MFGGEGGEGAAVEVVARSDVLTGRLLVHVGEVVLHLGRGEQGYVVQVQGGEDVGLEIGV